MSKQVLIFDQNRTSSGRLAEQFATNDITSQATSIFADALNKVQRNGLDAVVCCIEDPTELSWVIRIKKKNPDIPVMVVSPIRDEGFNSLAIGMGASAVQHPDASLKAITDAVDEAIENLKRSTYRAGEAIVRTKTLTKEIIAAISHGKELVTEAHRMANLRTQIKFNPIVMGENQLIASALSELSKAEMMPWAPAPSIYVVIEDLSALTLPSDGPQLPVVLLSSTIKQHRDAIVFNNPATIHEAREVAKQIHTVWKARSLGLDYSG